MQDDAPTPSQSPAIEQNPAPVNAPVADAAPAAAPVDQTTPAQPAAEPEVKPSWPDDWREKAAKGDEKRLNKLSRYTSPEAALDALFEAQKKLSSGELKSAKPKGDTPEEIAEWRKENGIPEKPEDYDLTLDNGLVIGDEDKPMIDEFVKSMHGVNATPEVVKAAVATYYELQEAQIEQMMQRNATAKYETEAALKAEWGQDYKGNLNALRSLIDSAPEEVSQGIFQASMPDGTSFLNNPNVVRWLTQMALESNPQHTIAPPAGSDRANAIADEINKYQKMLGDHSSEYWKGPNAEKNQARFRQLLEIQSSIK